MTLFHYYVYCYVFVTVLCYSEDFSDGYYYHRAFPQDIMVDVINNFGLALLEVHNQDNENNIAFSPYGTTSVLVALGEGVRGYAVKEIQEATRIPLDISVIRVGLRDIHRHLKSYFIPKEGFLAGLTLSNEKVPLIPRYEEILRFYGYDLDSFNNPLYPDIFDTTQAVYMNVTTMVTPFVSEATPSNENVTTMEMVKPISTDSKIEITENTESIPNKIDEKVNFSSDNTTIQLTTEEVGTETNMQNFTVSVSPFHDTTALKEYNTTVMPILASTEKRIEEATEITLSTMIITTTIPLTTATESRKDTDSSSSNSNVEEVIQPTTVEPQETLTTNTDLYEITSTTTKTSTLKDIQSETYTENMNALINATTQNPKSSSTLSFTLEPMTSSSLSEINSITTETSITKDIEPLTQKQNLYELINMTTQNSLIDVSSDVSGSESTTFKIEDALELSDMIQDDADMSTPFPEITTFFTTFNPNAEVFIITTTNANTLNSTTELVENSVPTNLNTKSEDLTESITQTLLHSTSELDEKAVAETDESRSTEDVTITTSITHSVSKVTVSYETSSLISTDLIRDENESESTLNVITTDSTENIANNDIDGLDVNFDSNNETTNSYSTDNFSEVTTINPDDTTKSTLNRTTKRGIRSIIDYVIARYYDNVPRRHYYERSYEPEDKLSFFVYGKVRETNINFMTYDAVLPIAYIPLIDALALSFPLDSKEYYLLLILPIDETGVDKLIHDLKLKISLRNIISSLKYAHVKAIIPSFMLKGYVILTSTLQKLGIRRIFEPRRTDFSLMTKEKDIYVTNVEQAVTVTIRNYVDPDNLPNYRNLQQFQPTEFKADHPFLYFVMDTDIHVNLMAGKIVNPLNSRVR